MRLTPSWAGGGGAGIAELAALPTGGFSGKLRGLGPGCVAQRGSPYGLDALADLATAAGLLNRRIPAPRRHGARVAVVVHTVDATGGDVAGVRWYEVRDPSTSNT